MKCGDFEERASWFLDGEMDGTEKAAWDEHLTLCPQCRGVLESYSRVDSIVSALPEEIPPALNPFDLMEKKGSVLGGRVQCFLRFAPVFAVILVVAGALFFLKGTAFLPVPSPSPAEGGGHSLIPGEAPVFDYHVELNDSQYSIALWGEEVKMVSLYLAEEGKGDITMSFEDQREKRRTR
ncbi:MAG: zf-HC2 domain-containing protein [Candidatus Eremiobacteraeota bacterium]|nr:zf-HC2 domain-containing protein [Candidatus Eremiobacteraeota bacterium]